MKRSLRLLQVVYLLPLFLPLPVRANTLTPDVLIVELQTTGPNNATDQEFVEIYNTTDQTIDISTWQLQYQSSTGTTWQTKATLNGKLYPKGQLLLASNGYLTSEANITFASGFKQDGGHVRLVSLDPTQAGKFIVHDLVGWGLATHPEGSPASAARAGESLQRKLTEDNTYIDTNNNQSDFAINTVPTPESNNVDPNPDGPDNTPSPDPNPPVDTPDSPSETPVEATPPAQNDPAPLLSLQITELLPNPGSPAIDSTDEFIELYNPNNEAIDLAGYKLQSGNSYSYSYTIDDMTILPLSYTTFYSSVTDLVLANSGGKARLLDPSGQVIVETLPYEDAKDNYAWVLANGAWQWSTTATPDSANVVTLPEPKAPAVKAATASSKAKKTTATKAATTSKKSKGTTAKTNSKKADDVNTFAQPATITIAPLHPGVIAVVSTLAVGYAAYEYRHDMSNRLYQLRRYREARRATRAKA